MATLNSTISDPTRDTLIGTESDQLISAGTGADGIGSQYASSSRGTTATTPSLPIPRFPVSVPVPPSLVDQVQTASISIPTD